MTTGIFAAFISLGGGDAANALYDVGPGEIRGKPGTIIRVWPLEGGGPGMGGNSDAFRILYRSTDPSGRPIPVSGAIYIPNGPAPADGRNIIAWAHPTSGVMPPCAPSLMPDVGGMMWNLPNMISQGYIVVATDYPGLGTDGIHPYLIGESEARSVLDSVRAARELPNTGASNRFAVWGHSQGGHAALYTGEVAARYAPDLKLVGVAAAAPATYLVELFDADESTEQDLLAMTILSWTRLENTPPATLVEPQAMPAFEKTARDCIESVAEFEAIEKDESPLKSGLFLKVDPAKTDPWKGIMLRNTPGQAPAGAPVFIAQGTADTTVEPEITKRFGEALCAQGVRVSFVPLPGVTHTFAARDSANAALNWMTERFRGAPAPSSCVR
ncbi:MAG TPA: alpha/beta fold hydrolase [Methyloceanibacter sp.]|nr:alpha/beta fold hydrolase [Methyloceanibacter sp.]